MATQKKSSRWWIGFVVILFVLADFAAAQPEPSLVAWWKFDDGGGDLAEDSAGINHAMVEGPVWTTGVINGALAFSGGCVRPEHSPVLDELALHDFTIAMWISTSNTGQSVLIGNYMEPFLPSWNFEISAGGVLRLYLDGEEHIDDVSVADGNWHHVAALRVGQEVKLYIDGQESYSGFSAKEPYMVTNPTLIGRDHREPPLSFGGVMDDVRIYEASLTPEQIKRLAGFATFPSPTDGAGMISVDAQLSWTAGVGALSHDVWFGTDNPPTTLIADDILDTNCFPDTLDCATVYYWQVDENMAAGTKTGDVWSFTTIDGKATAPQPTNWASGVSVYTDLSWTAGVCTLSHDVWFGTDNPPMTLIGNDITDTNIYPGPLQLGLTYYWFVDENTSAGTIMGDVWSFTTHSGYSLTVNVEPVAGGSVTLAPPGGLYPPDTEVTLTAEPAPGWAFGYWSGDLAGDTNPAAIIMDSAKTVYAHFEFTGAIIYVNDDANGLNNGISWANALTDLQDALAGATPGKQIWVAAGTYKPGTQLTDSFQMKNGVGIYGGFAASGDPGWGDRDPNEYITILSGDLNDNDIPGLEHLDTFLDNCTHIFYHPNSLNLDSTAILNGFTISGGFGFGAGESSTGPGMYNNTASPTVTHCRFSNNFAVGDIDTPIGKGGGMYNVDSSPTVMYCEFSTNFSSDHGTGMYNLNSAPTVIDCNFAENSSYHSGAGMYNSNSAPTVIGCNFAENSSNYSGGGMYNLNSDPQVMHCNFTANIILGMGTDGNGGGGMANIGSNPTVTDCTFVENQAVNPEQLIVLSGGGMLIRNSSSPTVTDCVFSGNLSEIGGGMVIGTGCSPTITDCTFSGNEAGEYGGGMGNSGTSIITGCEFSSNTAEVYGGGLCSAVVGWTLNQCIFLNNSTGYNGGGIYLGESSTVTNCIFGDNSAGNDGGGIYIVSHKEPIVTNCTFYHNTAGRGGGIFTDDYAKLTLTNSILWTDSPEEIYKTALGTVTVRYCDIQSGDYVGSSGNILEDPIFVDAPGSNFHLRDNSPCINAGTNTAPGLPTEDIDGNYRIMDGRVEIGADEIAPIYVNASASGRNKGTNWGDAFTDFQDAVDSSPGGVDIWVAAGAYKPGTERTDSFGLRGGEVIYGGFPETGNPDWDDRNSQVYPTILSGDIGVEGSAADNCYHVMHNEGRAGQAVSYLDGFIITGGQANGSDEDSRGGGIYNFFFDLYLANCLLVDNSADIGGGMCSLGSFVSLVNCLITNNTAVEGGAMYNFLSFQDLINCTVSGNDAGVGGGVFNGGFAEMSASNCIFWSNNGGEIYNDVESFAEINFSDVEGGYGGPDANNIDADPCFVDAAAGNLRLKTDSPCIDRGDSNAVPPEVTTDPDGNPRILDGDCSGMVAVDMGAYEFSFAYIGDFEGDCDVDFFDYAVLASSWLLHDSQTGYDPVCDISLPPDKFIDWNDLKIFTDNWLAGTEPQ